MIGMIDHNMKDCFSVKFVGIVEIITARVVSCRLCFNSICENDVGRPARVVIT